MLIFFGSDHVSFIDYVSQYAQNMFSELVRIYNEDTAIGGDSADTSGGDDANTSSEGSADTSGESSSEGSAAQQWVAKEYIGQDAVLDLLSKGNETTIYTVEGQNNRKYAVKVFCSDGDAYDSYVNEIEMLCRVGAIINTPNIVRVVDIGSTFAVTDKLHVHPYIKFEYYEGSIHDYTKNGPIKCAKRIVRDMYAGLAHIHAAGVIHGDIKADNLLYRIEKTRRGSRINTYIADFGVSTTQQQLFSSRPGTVRYQAPEIIAELPYTIHSDLWSAAATTFEIITGAVLFDVYGETECTYGAFDADEIASDDDNVDHRYLTLVTAIIGRPPMSIARELSYHFTRYGAIKDCAPAGMPAIGVGQLMEQFVDRNRVAEEFIENGLQWTPSRRPTAEAMLVHKWLK
jgi:serine/threonine protein kinase